MLGVLDGAVLVVSAVEGVQSQTLVLMRALQRLRIPTLLFVNKIDRGGSRRGCVVSCTARSRERSTPARRRDRAHVGDGAPARPRRSPSTTTRSSPPSSRTSRASRSGGCARRSPRRRGRRSSTRSSSARRSPAPASSALMAGDRGAAAGARAAIRTAPVSGRVFKIERGAAGEKIAYVRMFSGTVHMRDRVRFGARLRGQGDGDRGLRRRLGASSATRVCAGRDRAGSAVSPTSGSATRSATPHATRSGARSSRRRRWRRSSSPTTRRRARLRVALAQLAEQDPLIDVRRRRAAGALRLALRRGAEGGDRGDARARLRPRRRRSARRRRSTSSGRPARARRSRS